MAVDPITLTVVWNTLVSIADEMGEALRRTAFSEAVREGADFSTGLFDRRGRLIAQGNFTPGHLGAMPYAVKNCLDYIPPDQLRPGDMLVTNDAYLGGGHFPDFFLVAPVFAGETLIGYVVNTAHHVDVGGAQPGSEAVQGVLDAFAEGIRILPVKIVRNGEFEPDIMRILLGNVRLPEKVRGDLMAQRNANHVGSQRLRRIFADYGEALIEEAIEKILDRSEARAKELIRALPEGTYSFDDQMDDYGPGTPPIHVRVDITLSDGTATVDFSRSGDAVPAGINSFINYTRAYASFAMRIFASIDVPNNAGIERVIKLVTRPGSFFDPRYPAAGGGRASLQVRIFDAINGAMAQVVPERAMGAFTHWANPKFGGIDPETGKRWILYDLILGGFGGRATKDGAEALCPVFNCANVPIEVHETNNPVRIHTLSLIQDSSGPGRFRGGCGMRKDIEMLTDGATVVLLGDRHRTAPWGVFGGGEGTKARTVLIRGGQEADLGSKEVARLQRGDIVSFRLAGAGGYGDPALRERAALIEDLKEGFLSREGIARHYGVMLD
ncbi:MAG: hydantoinase B/oxoprolinase family protein [Roseomonas sp.]|nr:hydantoinase B/oxoprolinase family protein [Roseomonas sp.]MCA3431033.1 hydantoinase B/oxoprolinase family protein [Roseomonas sp.]MCA3434304.1 hydantoinase B/oxoprolinase family protein [Roseomonas sp.]